MPVKHFTLKRKPKSAQLRTELLHKSADAQSSLKKSSAPTIPLRSRGMPRKMTDTTPLKGIPSRMPTTGFRSPSVPGNAQRPNLSRTPAGRKDGGIKILEFTEQPLGYAAAKKRKREQQLEEQQKKQEQKQQAAAAAAAQAAANISNNSDSPPAESAANNASGGETPTTSVNNSFEIKLEPQLNQSSGSIDEQQDEQEFKTPELATKTLQPETPGTPEYAAATLQFAQTNTAAVATTPSRKTESKAKVTKSTAKANNNNNNSYHQTPKRIKQEIEIKSEEIIVPANIKLEKIEPTISTTPTQTTPKTPLTAAPTQRIIIQQQQPTQRAPHLLIRSTPQQQKRLNNSNNVATTTAATTTTTVGNTTIKMEKLDIKPMSRAAATPSGSGSSGSSSTTTTTTTILTPQQLRQATSPLANLPNNISVKITSAKAKVVGASAAGSSGSQTVTTVAATAQQQQPILINSSTPVILASTPSAQRVVCSFYTKSSLFSNILYIL